MTDKSMAGGGLRPSPIRPTVELDAPGLRHGFLKLPYSSDASAWGSVMTPICVAANGEGPTALLTGGNHGDEYEGPVALYKLAAALDLSRIRGRIIIVPAMNYPALDAGRRTSPIDNGNLNRVFPGSPTGTVTEKIADFFCRHLLPRADVVLDIHSGGRTLEFLPFAACHALDDKEHEGRCIAAMKAFGAPWSVIMTEMDPTGLYDTAVEELGKTFVTTELGGGGTARASTVRIAERGILNLLRHAGILEGEPEPAETTLLTMPDEGYLVSEHHGLVEPCVDLGEFVCAGQPVARVIDQRRTAGAVIEYRAPIDGVLAGRHFPGMVKAGDCLGVLAVET
ncbi:N-alpha-acetyl-L-2,4-diaminobutyrate deacetylase [Tistlia consotensis]|uniref:N-alpha-acetyl-L-2,4-diaminobutyrate deacetylase n=1 Tax=Tistlia consotensis USBA 355 TaxID=560819 RepID=A0A1Y6CIM9_9PROT|nr:N(2)-acetyl-L-2,4-diaminobutanoate deacetylase DoeB [Tistlia consotensis]SMF56907.1 N-alpha-acetyl-L-2,4-diaminobutyrate deacetylase [Tistlia consotensis USBA 355]SNR45072.1 N-alpha-acetyl-L-2,4-diaminobutyrate deacetylase [Tistlia consotensis]